MSDWNAQVIEEFSGNDGRVGGFTGRPLLLLTTTGRRTGTRWVNPLMYISDGDRLVVFASKGGAPNYPDWFRNFMSDPEVTVEVGTGTYQAEASVVHGAERDRLWAEMTRRFPQFAEYETKTDRVIPVIALVRTD